MKDKNVRRHTAAHDPEMQELFTELNDTHFALTQAYARFDRTTEPELVEACVYEINAVQARYNYLLRVIKERSGRAAAGLYTEGAVTWV